MRYDTIMEATSIAAVCTSRCRNVADSSFSNCAELSANWNVPMIDRPSMIGPANSVRSPLTLETASRSSVVPRRKSESVKRSA